MQKRVDAELALTQYHGMKICFVFERGATPKEVADAAGVDLSTAYRWKQGKDPESTHVARLFSAGLLTVQDLRAAGEMDSPVTVTETTAPDAPVITPTPSTPSDSDTGKAA